MEVFGATTGGTVGMVVVVVGLATSSSGTEISFEYPGAESPAVLVATTA